MLVIQPTADGRLRIFNNHRSEYARDESSARTLAYNWGHTDISINKALSEMRSATRGEPQPSGWRVTRDAPKPAPNTVLAPVKPAAPAAKAPAKPRAKAAPVAAPPRETPPAAAAKAPAKTAAKAPAKAPAKVKPVKAAAPKAKPPVKAVAKAVAKAAPAKADPRERALAHLRAGVRELAAIEEGTLAFARGPWSDLREMAEYVTACLEGKRPKTGWERK